MPRTLLPENLDLSDGVLLEGFQDASEWTPGTGNTVENDTSEYKYGTKSVRLVSTASASIRITKPINIDFSDIKILGLWVYFENISALDSITIRLSPNADPTNFGVYMGSATLYNHNYELHSGWNYLKFIKSDFTAVGGATWGIFRAIRFVIAPQANQKPNIKFGRIDKDPVGIPYILLDFDDSSNSMFANAFPYMRDRGIKGTMFVCSDHTDTGNYLTTANHDTLYAAGWDLANHSKTHTSYATLTAEEVKYELNYCDRWLTSRGYTRANKISACPSGSFNDTTLEVMDELGYLLNRGNAYNFVNQYNDDEKYQIPTFELRNTTTLASIKAWIDRAIFIGSTVSIFTHGIVDSDPDAYGTTTAIYQAVIDYILEKKIECLTYSEWHTRLLHPRKTAGARTVRVI